MTQVSFLFWRNLSHRHWSAVVVTSLILCLSLSLASIAHAQEREGQFCPDCMDQASAQLVAESMAPPPASGPGCDDFIPLGLGDDTIAASSDEDDYAVSCIVPVRRVFIVNHHTGMVYAFDVWTEGSGPNAAPAAISAEEQLLVEHAIEVRVAWDATIEGLAQGGAQALMREMREQM